MAGQTQFNLLANKDSRRPFSTERWTGCGFG
jgi:hypothetical protein